MAGLSLADLANIQPDGDQTLGSLVRPESVGLTNRYIDPNNPLTRGLASKLAELAGYYKTPGDLLLGSLAQRPEVPGQWSEADDYIRDANAHETQRRGMMMGLDAMTGAIPFAQKGALGMAGGRMTQPASTAALPMDDVSRMARADAAGFRRNTPIAYGTAPEGEKIAAAAINANDRVFTGPNHLAAVQRAETEIGVPFESMKLAPIMDGFVTDAGRYVGRWEAADVAQRAGQGETKGVFGATRGLASEDVKAGKASPSSVSTGATEPGLPGGQGVWGRLLPEGSPAANALWHRAERPAVLDVRGSLDHEIQASLKSAWDNGFDAVKLKNYTTPAGKSESVVVVKNPSQLRSPDAAFDPARKNSANLLAGFAGLSAVPAGLMLSDLAPRQ